jgi:hypothetical protein
VALIRLPAFDAMAFACFSCLDADKCPFHLSGRHGGGVRWGSYMERNSNWFRVTGLVIPPTITRKEMSDEP